MWHKIAIFLASGAFLFTTAVSRAQPKDTPKHKFTLASFYDENKVRYRLVQSHGGKEINWLFIPGGPGADSRYLLTLIDILGIPGNVWLIDLPGSGDNIAPDSYNYKTWLSLLPSVVSHFTNCIVVGHSLGGMLPLLSPSLENKISGLIILNSAPSLWLSESEKIFKEKGIPTLPEKEIFLKAPTQENFNNLLAASPPYYFTSESFEKGAKLFQDLPFPIHTMKTVFSLFQDINYKANWVPQKVRTLIIGGDQDYINPFSLFQKDKRFDRPNIHRVLLKGCGHWCWIEKPKEVKALFDDFYKDF